MLDMEVLWSMGRIFMELALQEMAFIIELGDTDLLAECGLLDPQHARIVVEHLVSVYYNSMNQDMGDQTECPIDWEQLGRQMLTTSGPDLTMQLLREAAKNLKPGTFSRGFLAELIMESIAASVQHGGLIQL